jgi:hypothetical protein
MAARESSALMGEESHLDEMRAAIRGDFERLERRRGAGAHRLLCASPPREGPPEPDDDVTRDEHPSRAWLARLLGR